MTVLFYALPALALLFALCLGHYPGERLRLRLARPRHLAGAPSRAAVPPSRPLLFARHRLPRGGALLGAALAGRAPPSPGSAASAAATDGKREERIQMNARKMVPAVLCALALLAPAAAAGPRDRAAERSPRRGVHGARRPGAERERPCEHDQSRGPVPGRVRRRLLPGGPWLECQSGPREIEEADPDRRRPGHRRRQGGHLQWRQAGAGTVPGLPFVGADPGQGRRRADLQSGADL